MDDGVNKPKKKKKFKKWSEIRADWERNWEKFVDDFNKFLGLDKLKRKKRKIEYGEPDHFGRRRVIIDISPEDIKDAPPYGESDGYTESGDDSAAGEDDFYPVEYIPKAPPDTPDWAVQWKKFMDSTMGFLDNIRLKITEWNNKNAEKIREQIEQGKINFGLWLKKQELKRKSLKEKQKLALERYKKWVEENNRRTKEFFEEQRRKWEEQLQKWQEEQKKTWKKNKERWEESRRKFKEDYRKWIEERRQRALEKAKFKLQIGWRQNLYMMLMFSPFILLILIIVILINAIKS